MLFAFGNKGTVEERLRVYRSIKDGASIPICNYNSAAKRKSNRLPLLAQRSSMPDPLKPPEVFRRHTAGDGKTYVLSTWGGFCNPDDLWVFEEAEGKLRNPIFTGKSAYIPISQLGIVKEGHEGDQAALSAFLNRWIERFVTDTSFRNDSDRDGYTDIAERWLGLDPNIADMDQDGVLDGQDVDPVAAQRKLTEEEQILQAAFTTALGCEVWKGNPLILIKWPKGIRPFDIGIENRLFLHEFEGMKKREGEGNLFGIRLSLTNRLESAVSFSADRTVATVDFEVGTWFYRFYEMKLQKIGDLWLPRSAMIHHMVP